MTIRQRILDLIGERSWISSGEIASALGISRQTAHRHLADLVKRGDLVQSGRGRATRYTSSPAVLLDEIARDLDAEAAVADHFQLIGKPIRGRITGQDDPLAPLAWPFDYMLLRPGEERRDQHGPFGPMLETVEGQYPPPLGEVTEESVALWEALGELVTHPYVKARLHDLMWERRRSSRPYEHALEAIDRYVDLASRANGLDAAHSLERAAELARAISDQSRGAHVAEMALDAAVTALEAPHPKPGIVLGFVDAALIGPEDVVEPRISELLENAKKVFPDPWISEQVVGMQVMLARGQDARVRELRQESIDRWRREAASVSGIRRRFFLTRALDDARDFGFPEAAEALRGEIQELAFDEGDTHVVSATVEISHDDLERRIGWIASAGDWQQCLERVASLGPLSGSWNRNRDVVQRQANEFPLQRLIPSHVVGPWNETLFVASSEADKDDLELSRHESVAISMASYTVADALDRTQATLGRPTKSALQSYFTTPIINPPTAERIGASVEHFAGGRFDECVMVLIPRIETVIRELARKIGAPTWWEPQRSRRFGIQRSLSQLLQQLTGLMDEDWRRYYLTLLVNPLGPNLRNLYMHGLASVGTRENAASLIHVAASLALLRLQTRAEGAEPSES